MRRFFKLTGSLLNLSEFCILTMAYSNIPIARFNLKEMATTVSRMLFVTDESDIIPDEC